MATKRKKVAALTDQSEIGQDVAQVTDFAPALIVLRKGGQDWDCDPAAEKRRIKHLIGDGFLVVGPDGKLLSKKASLEFAK